MALQPARVDGGAGRGLLSGGPLKPFSYPQFRLYWAASLCSVMPFVMGMAARGWLVLVETESPFMVTAAQAVLLLPMALFTPFGGVIADRLNRKMVLLAGDVANLLVLVVMAVLLFLDVIQVWQIFLLAFLNGTAFSMSWPARATVVNDLVGRDDAAKGVAIYTIIFSTCQLSGPALAGYLMDISPDQFGWAFLAAAAFPVPAIALLLLVRVPDKPAALEGERGPSVIRSIAEGLSHIKASSLLTGLMLMIVVIAMFGLPFQSLLPVFAKNVLGTGPDGLGLLLSAAGGGAIAGSFMVAVFNTTRRLRVLIFSAAFVLGPTIILFAFSPYFLTSLVLAVCLGLLLQSVGVSTFVLVQVGSPAHIRGRVIGILMLAWGFGPAGMILLGLGAEVLDPKIAMMVMGVISFALIAVLTLAVPALRRMELGPVGRTPAPLAEALSGELRGSSDDD